MHVQVELIDEHNGLCVPRRMFKSRVGLSQSAGEVDQHSQEPTPAVGELAQIESRAALVHDEPGLVATFYSEVVELTQEAWECLLDTTVCPCGPSLRLSHYHFLPPH